MLGDKEKAEKKADEKKDADANDAKPKRKASHRCTSRAKRSPTTSSNKPCTRPRVYAVRINSDLSPLMAACAAASLAIGTR